MDSGKSAPEWLILNFLQPLAIKHTTENQANTDVINSNIQNYAASVCSACNLHLNPSANNAKDQELTCNRCGNSYHKK